jgi:hypothetical protein
MAKAPTVVPRVGHAGSLAGLRALDRGRSPESEDFRNRAEDRDKNEQGDDAGAARRR